MTGLHDSIRVLHVDDEPDFAEMAGEFLERRDERITVETAASAAEGVALLTDGEFDCVVADYDMPGENGLEFLERVREAYPDLPFMLFTGKGSEEVASEAVSAGVTDYLQKTGGTDQYTVLANRIANAVSARRSALKADRRRHRLTQMLKTVPACVVRIDSDGRFVFANDRAEDVLGLERSEVSERTYNDPEWDITDLDGEPIPDERLPFRQVMDTGEPVYGFRHTVEWPDGTRKVLLVNGAPLFDGDGDVESTVFALTDVTERREREQELRETEERLRLVERCAEIGYWELDVRGEPTKGSVLSEGFLRVLGVDSEARLDLESALDFFEPGDRSDVEDAISRATETGASFSVEARLRTGDGDRRWVRLSGEPVVEAGETVTLRGALRDVTERKRLDRRLEAITETTTKEAIYLKDTDGRYLFINPAGASVFKREPDEVIGKRAAEMYDSVDRERLAVDERVMETEEPVRYEVTRSVDGERLHFLAEKFPYYEEGELFGLVGISRDITDRKRKEEEIERQNERLDEFASVVTHDLRNPLNVARGRLELAIQERDSEHLEAIGNAHARMETLIEDVLSLARAGESVGETETVEASELVDACWRNVRTDTAELVNLVDRTVEGDRTRLQQLLENLFRNAVEHGGAGVTVTVGDLPGGFYVEDDGPGIPRDEREEVFEYGYSTSEEGTGFGLSIVRDIAEAHGWEMDITSGTDGGVRFEFTWDGVRP